MKDRSWDVARAVLCSIKNPCADITENPKLGETLLAPAKLLGKQVQGDIVQDDIIQGDALYFETLCSG